MQECMRIYGQGLKKQSKSRSLFYQLKSYCVTARLTAQLGWEGSLSREESAPAAPRRRCPQAAVRSVSWVGTFTSLCSPFSVPRALQVAR